MEAARRLTGHEVPFYGAGRTDQGVHAMGQVAHGDFQRPWEPHRLRMGLNYYLKNRGVVVCAVAPVSRTFHARFDALWRRYVYRIVHRSSPCVLDQGRAWWLIHGLDMDALNQGAKRLCGEQDFSAFRNKDCQSVSPVKTLDEATVCATPQGLELHFQAKSFLHRQVRMMVGVLVWLGQGKGSLSELDALFQSPSYPPNATVAPAHGLYLVQVGYPCFLF